MSSEIVNVGDSASEPVAHATTDFLATVAAVVPAIVDVADRAKAAVNNRRTRFNS